MGIGWGETSASKLPPIPPSSKVAQGGGDSTLGLLPHVLWRITESSKADRFILKGAQLFAIWEQNPHRPTRDIDFLGFGDPTQEAMETFFAELLGVPADPEDGMVWGQPSAGSIRDDQSYGGIRVAIPVSLAGARVRIQIDIGFGDTVTPGPEEHTWNELLGYPAAKLKTYPPRNRDC